MRVVLDSNIYVSAFGIPGGRAEKAILAAAEGRCRLVLSRPIVHEVLNVLAAKFDRNAEELARVAVFMTELGDVVQPRRTQRVLADDPDNRILECAQAGRADLIVTGDQAMLALGAHGPTRIVSLRDFLAILRSDDAGDL